MRLQALIVGLVGALIVPALMAKEPSAAPARLAHGLPIDGAIQKTNAVGLVVQTSKEVKVLPWKYLSVGTRYRSERAFRAQQAADRLRAANQAADAKAAADVQTASSQSPAPTNTSVKATNAPLKKK